MSCFDDVLKIGKKLGKMIKEGTPDQGQALDILKTLKKQPMTLEVLQKTHIGMTVNNFRKASSNDEVISLAKTLIKSWKKLLPDGSSQSSSSSQLSRSNSTASNSPKDEDSSQPETSETKERSASGEAPKQTDFPPDVQATTDGVRLKCRDMLANALKVEPVPENGGDPARIAAAIESAIYDEFNNTDSKYKNRIRSRYANLKDTRNPQLRANVLTGVVPPDRMAVMTPDEMANEAMKELRAKFTKEAISDHQMSVTGGTTTDLLKCGKCGKRNCTYNQVQTRSADEPMTTFVLCNECGNRWKFC